jgi:hypothetical protein
VTEPNDLRFELSELVDSEELRLRRAVARLQAATELRDLSLEAGAASESIIFADFDDVAAVLGPIERARWSNALESYIANDEHASGDSD